MNCNLRNDGKKRNKGPNAKSCITKGGEGCCLEKPFKNNCKWKTGNGCIDKINRSQINSNKPKQYNKPINSNKPKPYNNPRNSNKLINCKIRKDGKKRNKGPNAKSCITKGGEGCCLEEPFNSNCEWKTGNGCIDKIIRSPINSNKHYNKPMNSNKPKPYNKPINSNKPKPYNNPRNSNKLINCKIRKDGKKRNKGPNAKSCITKGGEGCCLEEPFNSNCEWKTGTGCINKINTSPINSNMSIINSNFKHFYINGPITMEHFKIKINNNYKELVLFGDLHLQLNSSCYKSYKKYNLNDQNSIDIDRFIILLTNLNYIKDKTICTDFFIEGTHTFNSIINKYKLNGGNQSKRSHLIINSNKNNDDRDKAIKRLRYIKRFINYIKNKNLQIHNFDLRQISEKLKDANLVQKYILWDLQFIEQKNNVDQIILNGVSSNYEFAKQLIDNFKTLVGINDLNKFTNNFSKLVNLLSSFLNKNNNIYNTNYIIYHKYIAYKISKQVNELEKVKKGLKHDLINYFINKLEKDLSILVYAGNKFKPFYNKPASINKFPFYYLKEIIWSIGIYMVDMYTIARMLRNFDKKKNNKNVWGGKNKDKCNGESLKKIINFAGQLHTTNYSEFLHYLAKKKKIKIEFYKKYGNEKNRNQCLKLPININLFNININNKIIKEYNNISPSYKMWALGVSGDKSINYLYSGLDLNSK